MEISVIAKSHKVVGRALETQDAGVVKWQGIMHREFVPQGAMVSSMRCEDVFWPVPGRHEIKQFHRWRSVN